MDVSPYKRQIDHFISRIASGRGEETGFTNGWAADADDGRAAVEMVFAAYQSSSEGVRIRF